MFDAGHAPLYHQLKNILRSQIVSGELKERERIPTETELCRIYNVSRITVKHALSQLIREGLIYRQRGKGTFVTEGTDLKQPELKGSIDNLIGAALGTKLKVLAYEEVVPPSTVANILQSGKKGKVFRLTTLRVVAKGPLGYSLMYFPQAIGKTISLSEINENTELITLAEAKLRSRAHRARQTIDATVADETVGSHLKVKPGTALLLIQRSYYTIDGSIMFTAVTYFRPDLYKYEIELLRD